MRRRRPNLSVVVTTETVPDALRAGRCIEVWAPDGDEKQPWGEVTPAWIVTWRRYASARRRWLAAVGLDERGPSALEPAGLRVPQAPWSFGFLAEGDPARLRAVLKRHGLPSSWRPAPAPPLDAFGPEPPQVPYSEWRARQGRR